MRVLSKRVMIVNILGGLGYMGALISWTLLIAVFFVLLVNSPFVTTGHTIVTSQVASPAPLSNIAMYASYGITAVVIAMSVVIFVTLPYFLSKGASRLLRRILKLLSISATRWHIWQLKALMTLIPCLVFVAMTTVGIYGDTVIAIFVTTFLSSLFSVGIFSLQHLAAWRLNVALNNIW